MPKTVYLCTKCQKTFPTFEMAERCEVAHVDCTGMLPYYAEGQVTPHRIRVSFGNGQTKVYTEAPETVEDWWMKRNIEVRGRII